MRFRIPPPITSLNKFSPCLLNCLPPTYAPHIQDRDALLGAQGERGSAWREEQLPNFNFQISDGSNGSNYTLFDGSTPITPVYWTTANLFTYQGINYCVLMGGLSADNQCHVIQLGLDTVVPLS